MIIDTIIGGIINAGMQAAARSDAEDARAWQSEENERNRAWAAEQAALDRKENYEYGEMSADSADARTRALYNDLESPSALLQQYKEAGLSPSLMFGGSGVGGQLAQGAQGTGANGVSTMQPAYKSPIEAEQAALLHAETTKTEAETAEKLGITMRSLVEISDLMAQKKMHEAEGDFKRADAAKKKLETIILGEMSEAQIRKAEYESYIYMNDLQRGYVALAKESADAKVAIETIQPRIEIVNEQLGLTNAQKFLTQANTNLSKAEVEKINAELAKWEMEIAQRAEEIQIALINAGTEQEKNEIIEKYYNEQNEILRTRVGIESKSLRHTIINDHIGNILNAASIVLSYSQH